jgi:hypothetical protein
LAQQDPQPPANWQWQLDPTAVKPGLLEDVRGEEGIWLMLWYLAKEHPEAGAIVECLLPAQQRLFEFQTLAQLANPEWATLPCDCRVQPMPNCTTGGQTEACQGLAVDELRAQARAIHTAINHLAARADLQHYRMIVTRWPQLRATRISIQTLKQYAAAALCSLQQQVDAVP